MLVAMFFRIRVAVDQISKVANEFQNRMGPILLRVNRILDDSEGRIQSIMSDASEITRVARTQAQKVDRVFTDAIERLRAQIIRADQILTGTLEVIEETGSKFKSTVWRPVQQASALIKGLKVGIDVLRGGGRRSAEAESVTQDEELFI
jgi:5-hydroxyisourate hydrolase-like protein (transthyretin family)